LKKAIDNMYKVMDIGMIILSITLVGVVFINIIARRIGMSMTWTDEVSRLAFVWLAMFAAAIAHNKGMHPAFTMLAEKLTAKNARILILGINLIIMIFLGFLLVGGIEYLIQTYNQKTSILGISVVWKYMAVPFAGAVMLIETILQTVSIWNEKKKI